MVIRMIQWKSRRLAILTVICAVASLAAGIVAFGIAQAQGPRANRDATARPRSGLAATASYVSRRLPARSSHKVSRALLAHFAILRRARITSDTLPSDYHLGPSVGRQGLDLAAAQAITFSNGQQGWFVPGSSGASLIYHGSAWSDDTASVLQGLVGGPPGTLVGVVPDGASVSVTKSDGSSETVPVADNAFSVSTSSADSFVGYQVRLSSGAVSTVNLPGGVG
jgi:hypothetical protein